jgi:hypothetical protein
MHSDWTEHPSRVVVRLVACYIAQGGGVREELAEYRREEE